MATISNFKKNSMGTISFDFIGANLRKAQNFCTYPIDKETKKIFFQSDKRWMELNLETMALRISKKGQTSWEATFHGYINVDTVSRETLEELLSHIRGTANAQAGKKENGVIMCDNSGASLI